MPRSIEQLETHVNTILAPHLAGSARQRDELTITVVPAQLPAVAKLLRDHPELQFEQLIDLCGVDYSAYGTDEHTGPRYGVVYHLLSLAHNIRLRMKTFAPSSELPIVPSMIDVWPAADWYEREAFDLFGIVFEGHPDLRRILTDYGFIGHPFRKDFPLSGQVEMRYDPEQKRVIYQPVTIEPREETPRIIREQDYGDVD